MLAATANSVRKRSGRQGHVKNWQPVLLSSVETSEQPAHQPALYTVVEACEHAHNTYMYINWFSVNKSIIFNTA